MTTLPDKRVCIACGWQGTADQVIRRNIPWNRRCVCPQCSGPPIVDPRERITSVECSDNMLVGHVRLHQDAEIIRIACDEPGCWREVMFGEPSPDGYRSTCAEHRPGEGNMSRYTEGPWNVDDEGNVCLPNGSDMIAWVTSPDDMEVFGESPETWANARLIAAAPDHHAAAIELDRLSLVIESAVRNLCPSHHNDVVAALKANRSAIAKATGAKELGRD